MVKDAVSLLGNFKDSFYSPGLPFAIYDAYELAYSNINLAAGTNILTLATLPDNFLVVLTNIAIEYVGTVPTAIYFHITRDANEHYVFSQPAPATAIAYSIQCNIVCLPGDIFKLTVTGATVNNDAHCFLLGYKMRVKA